MVVEACLGALQDYAGEATPCLDLSEVHFIIDEAGQNGEK